MDSKFEPISSSLMSPSTEDLLKAKSDMEDDYFDDNSFLRKRSDKHYTRYIASVMVHLALITVYTLAFFFFIGQNDEKWSHGPNLIYCIS
jgi:hypothetical protein